MSKDYAAYAAKEITPTMKAYHEWLQKETGLELDLRSVALAGSLRGDFQKSDFWKSHEDNYLANVEANREAKAREALERAQEAERKATERVAKAKAKAELALAAATAAADAAKAKTAKTATANKKAAA